MLSNFREQVAIFDSGFLWELYLIGFWSVQAFIGVLGGLRTRSSEKWRLLFRVVYYPKITFQTWRLHSDCAAEAAHKTWIRIIRKTNHHLGEGFLHTHRSSSSSSSSSSPSSSSSSSSWVGQCGWLASGLLWPQPLLTFPAAAAGLCWK